MVPPPLRRHAIPMGGDQGNLDQPCIADWEPDLRSERRQPDVELMAETLGAAAECDVRIDDAASRQGILDTHTNNLSATRRRFPRTLSSSTTQVTEVERPCPTGKPFQKQGSVRTCAALVPFDMESSTETDFRGLLAEEVSVATAPDRPNLANVTTILDCCHSGACRRMRRSCPRQVGREFSIEAAIPVLHKSARSAVRRSWTTRTTWQFALWRATRCSRRSGASSLGGRHGALTEAFVLLLRQLGHLPGLAGRGRPVAAKASRRRCRCSALRSKVRRMNPVLTGFGAFGHRLLGDRARQCRRSTRSGSSASRSATATT